MQESMVVEHDDEWHPIEDAIESEGKDFISSTKRLLWLSSGLEGSVVTELEPNHQHDRGRDPSPAATSDEGTVYRVMLRASMVPLPQISPLREIQSKGPKQKPESVTVPLTLPSGHRKRTTRSPQ